MGRACCVLGCVSGGDVPSHQIPKNPDLFRKWKNAIYSTKIEQLTDEQLSKCTVCHHHFISEDYLVTYRVRKLKRGVVPSVNLPYRPVKEGNIESNASINISTEVKVKVEETMEEEASTFAVGLFEDLPETLDLLKQSSIPEEASEQSCQQLDMNMEQISLIPDVSKAIFKTETSKRKLVRLTEEQCQRKKQAEKYAKAPTIQKLLSFLTVTERSSLQRKIKSSKYAPKVYIRLYHDIAKKKALSQL
ncbi:uncharacterized protein LOC116842713 [Odontomachus brunneus]|uniref:uncharacterized protein LOC116842713 n=1 Tax=Odontomachus brunneus TaxID=486640 RepID=UPI0013F1D092|nr:uncharacterized protein LOC116842713 [Odontomachus brunneus]XP_032668200.1 uncharacterized protein LOC116842713 [Odontomachus brunneus]